MDESDNRQLTFPSFTNEPAILKKPVQAIHMAVTGGLLQKRIQRLAFNVMLRNAQRIEAANPNASFDQYSISRRELMRLIQYTSSNRKHLKELLTEMQDFKVQWDILEQDEKPLWQSCVLLPMVGFDNDNVYYSFSPQIKPLLFESTIYSRLDISVQAELGLDCSVTLYEWCNRFRDNPAKKTSSMPWEKWRWAIYGECSPTSSLNEYKIFKREKLKPAIAEINQRSDLVIELVEEKQGVRVKDLWFKVEVKSLWTPVDSNEVRALWEKRFIELDIHPRYRRKLHQYSPEELQAHYDYTMKRVQDTSQPPLRAIGAYFRHAIENGFAKHLVAQQISHPDAPSHGAKVDELLSEFNKERSLEAACMFDEMDLDDRDKKIEEYNKTAPKGQQVPDNGAKRSPRYMIPFYSWLATHTWGEPDIQEIVAFAVRTKRMSA